MGKSLEFKRFRNPIHGYLEYKAFWKGEGIGDIIPIERGWYVILWDSVFYPDCPPSIGAVPTLREAKRRISRLLEGE